MVSFFLNGRHLLLLKPTFSSRMWTNWSYCFRLSSINDVANCTILWVEISWSASEDPLAVDIW